MPLFRHALATSLLLAAAQASLAASSRPDPVDIKPRACPQTDAIPHGATCLRATVPEDYDKPAGRTIGLDIVVLKATRRDAHRPPLFVLSGGPGDRTTFTAADEVELWTAHLREHDLVFVDQRGNGETPDLACASPDASPASLMTDLWPAAPLAACAHRLSASADLARYTTTDAARDLDNVRAALGYAQIDIVGYSYGTRLAQEVLRRDDAAVHAALLIGPMAPAMSVPSGMAQAMQRSLAATLDRCKADAACTAAWPDVDGDLRRLEHRFAQGPLVLHATKARAAGAASAATGMAMATATDATDKDLAIAPGVIASFLRGQLYSATGAATLPRRIHALSDPGRDQAELGRIAAWRKAFDSWAPMGMYMAITCAEDVPFVDIDAERRAASGTLLGSYRVDMQSAACRAWPREQPNAAVHAPVVSAVPTLLLVGEFDPATPPGFAPGIVASLAHGRAVVVPNRGHSLPEDWDACIGKVSTAFLETADAAHLDTACVARLRMPPFVTTPVAAN